jgi:hypothetical protein
MIEPQQCEDAARFEAKIEKWVFRELLSSAKPQAFNKAKVILLDEYGLVMNTVDDYHHRIRGHHICIDAVFKDAVDRIRLLERDREPMFTQMVEAPPPKIIEQVFTVEGMPHVWDED